MTTVAVMQPTFLPWLGYFAMIEAADHFVFLDDVQFSKQSWQSRNRIKGPNGEIMVSLGVARKPSKPLIKDAKLADTGFETKLIATVTQAYAKAPFGSLLPPLLEQAFAVADGKLAALNIHLIKGLCRLAGITARFHQSNDVITNPTSKSQNLLDMTRALGGTRYLSPVGSLDYLAQDNAFEGSDVALDFLNFEHPTYDQGGGTFISHLAAIDALAHVGPDTTGALIRAGMHTPMTIQQLQEQIG